VRPVDADETKLAQCLRDRIRILTHVDWQSHDRIAGRLPNALDRRRGIAFEDTAILRVRDCLRGVLRGLPVGIVRAPLDVVDLLAIEVEGDAQFDQRLDLALSRNHAFARRGDWLEVTGSDRGETGTARP